MVRGRGVTTAQSRISALLVNLYVYRRRIAYATLELMKVVILYRPNSEHGRQVESFIRDFQATHPDVRLEIDNIDSREGGAMASLYDVLQYPAILALREDGSLLRAWEGDMLPLMDEVASYAYS